MVDIANLGPEFVDTCFYSQVAHGPAANSFPSHQRTADYLNLTACNNALTSFKYHYDHRMPFAT